MILFFSTWLSSRSSSIQESLETVSSILIVDMLEIVWKNVKYWLLFYDSITFVDYIIPSCFIIAYNNFITSKICYILLQFFSVNKVISKILSSWINSIFYWLLHTQCRVLSTLPKWNRTHYLTHTELAFPCHINRFTVPPNYSIWALYRMTLHKNVLTHFTITENRLNHNS